MPKPAITPFRGDWTALARMMQESWGTNRQEALRYTEEFLESAFQYPGATFELAPAIYSGDDPAAFVAGFPRRVRLNGQPVSLVLNSFLTASLNVRNAGYGLMVWRALLDRARETGYDGTINFCVEGDDMNKMMPSIARLFRLNATDVYRIEYLSRFLRPASGDARAVPAGAVDLLLELASQIPERVPLSRIWTRGEAEWHLCARSGTIGAVVRHGDRRGMLAGYVAEVGTSGARVAIIDDLLWGNLDAGQCVSLVREFMHVAAVHGSQSVSCPVLGYASIEPLAAAGFRRSKRVLHTYLTLWNGEDPTPLDSLYIDVF